MFGLSLEVDRPIGGLVAVPAAPRVDVRVSIGGRPAVPEEGTSPWYVSAERDGLGRPALTIRTLPGGAGYRLRYPDGEAFDVDRAGRRVWASEAAAASEDLALYLVGPVLAFVLRLRGVTCLHASAVAVGGRAVALVGPSGAGKSTTAAALALRGFSVLTDDLLALSDRGDAVVAQPGFCRLQLRPGATGVLRAAGGPAPRLTPTPDRGFLDLDLARDGFRFQGRPLPMGAVYLLEGRRDDPSAPSIAGVPGAEGLVNLVANAWATRVPDRAMRAAEFTLLGRLAALVPVRRVRPHADPALLPRLCDALVDDVQECTRTALRTDGLQHGSCL
jgi:hypothetical protein